MCLYEYQDYIIVSKQMIKNSLSQNILEGIIKSFKTIVTK